MKKALKGKHKGKQKKIKNNSQKTEKIKIKNDPMLDFLKGKKIEGEAGEEKKEFNKPEKESNPAFADKVIDQKKETEAQLKTEEQERAKELEKKIKADFSVETKKTEKVDKREEINSDSFLQMSEEEQVEALAKVAKTKGLKEAIVKAQELSNDHLDRLMAKLSQDEELRRELEKKGELTDPY